MEIATVPFYSTFALLMKRFLFFLLSFSLLLCSKNTHALGTTHASTSPRCFEVQKASFDTGDLLFHTTPVSISGVKEPEPTILAMEDQNEDEDLIKKHLAIAKSFAAFACAFLLNYSPGSAVEHLSVTRQTDNLASCKYIFQRVLRI